MRWNSHLKSNAIKILIMKSSIRWKMHIEIKLLLLCGISSACRLRWQVHIITIISLVECIFPLHAKEKYNYNFSGCTVTGKSLAHFFSNFLWLPLGKKGPFWNQNWSHSGGEGQEKIREKMCKTFAHHCRVSTGQSLKIYQNVRSLFCLSMKDILLDYYPIHPRVFPQILEYSITIIT